MRALLEAFSRQQLDSHGVMRGLVGHEDWLVPAAYAAQTLGRQTLERVVMFGERIVHPANALLVYTDAEVASSVFQQGGLLGPFEGGIRGSELFSRIPPSLEAIIVNEGAPTAQKLYLRAPSFGNVQVWVDVVAFEAQLAGPNAVAAARGYDAYFISINPDGNMTTLTNFAGMKNVGVLCTAPDCLAATIAAIEKVSPGPFSSGQTTGERIFELLPRLGVDGLVINPTGPGARRAFTLQELLR